MSEHDTAHETVAEPLDTVLQTSHGVETSRDTVPASDPAPPPITGAVDAASRPADEASTLSPQEALGVSRENAAGGSREAASSVSREAAPSVSREAASGPPGSVEATAAPPVEAPENAWVKMGRELVSGVQTLVSAAVYATLIVTFGFQVARVDGLSMAPTLEDHDRLIVNKLVYELGDPRPGDIVMLYYPLNPEKMFVKRVIAKEGDTVRIVDGRVYVNDIPLHDDYVPAEFRSHDDWGPQVVQQGYYFVMGDHRNNSSDSRHWGPVPKKYIVGKVKVRWWPLQDARIF
jgi:signal peptidase I